MRLLTIRGEGHLNETFRGISVQSALLPAPLSVKVSVFTAFLHGLVIVGQGRENVGLCITDLCPQRAPFP